MSFFKLTFFSGLTKCLLAACLVASCASDKYTRQGVLGREGQISQLHGEVEVAKKNELSLKSPEMFDKASRHLENAIAAARKGSDSSAGSKEAENGLAVLDRARKNAMLSEEELRLAYQQRSRAKLANAVQLYPERIQNADQRLIEAAKKIEVGNLKKAREIRDEVIEKYSQLELLSLKKGTLATAQQAFEDAKNNEAKKYAPASFKLAEKEMDLAIGSLEADRGDLPKARSHADRAKYLSERAKEIAILAKSFDRRKFSREDSILWYHDQLKQLATTLGMKLQFNTRNEQIVGALNRSIEDALTRQQMGQGRISQLEKSLGRQVSKTKEEELARSNYEQKFRTIENLFAADEASAYRQRNNVLLVVQGFYFTMGQAQLDARNYPLMDKIVDAIKEFPDALVEVTGHTDSSGSTALNMRLSEQRAQNVTKFLVTVGGLSQDRVSFRGLGESRPIATNDTVKGRALNRRIEVLIQNDKGPLKGSRMGKAE